jgi:hypothetical protein
VGKIQENIPEKSLMAYWNAEDKEVVIYRDGIRQKKTIPSEHMVTVRKIVNETETMVLELPDAEGYTYYIYHNGRLNGPVHIYESNYEAGEVGISASGRYLAYFDNDILYCYDGYKGKISVLDDTLQFKPSCSQWNIMVSENGESVYLTGEFYADGTNRSAVQTGVYVNRLYHAGEIRYIDVYSVQTVADNGDIFTMQQGLFCIQWDGSKSQLMDDKYRADDGIGFNSSGNQVVFCEYTNTNQSNSPMYLYENGKNYKLADNILLVYYLGKYDYEREGMKGCTDTIQCPYVSCYDNIKESYYYICPDSEGSDIGKKGLFYLDNNRNLIRIADNIVWDFAAPQNHPYIYTCYQNTLSVYDKETRTTRSFMENPKEVQSYLDKSVLIIAGNERNLYYCDDGESVELLLEDVSSIYVSGKYIFAQQKNDRGEETILYMGTPEEGMKLLGTNVITYVESIR